MMLVGLCEQFDLVCDRKLLGGLVQSFVIMGQGVGAFTSSMLSDKSVQSQRVGIQKSGLPELE
jgi:hypothetical protein